MRARLWLVVAVLVLGLVGCGGTSAVAQRQPTTSAAGSASPQKQPHKPSTTHPTKLLVIVEENHSATEMQSGMPYLWSLAQQYGYASDYTAMSHPSLPNYLAIAGGSTFGITDDYGPSTHPLSATSVFDQAVSAGKTVKVYAESMPSACDLTSASPYAVRHNPWTYFVPGRSSCAQYDVPDSSFLSDAKNNQLPNAGMLVPDLCNDAHSCSLATADAWLKARLPTVLASSDFTSGQLAVVVTADEDDKSSGNQVLTVVLDANLSGTVVSTPLNHYSLSRFYSDTIGATPLANARNAADMRAAFGL
jgi:phosphatidylinositol-3-phosphatase